MKKLIIIFTILAVALAIPTVAADYNDVKDVDVARAVAVLDSLGVVNGYADGGYHPDSTLTRAELSKLITVLLGEEDKLSSYSQKTLFSDVTSAHWGAPYVNLVYSKGLLKGYGNGRFGPDDKVTAAQLLTVMLRLLDYTDNEIGTVYPDDHIAMANRLELCEGVEANADESISRGDTAILLVNLIRAETRNGSKYYKKMASSIVENAIVLSSDATSVSGESGCVKLYAGGKTVWYRKGVDIPDELIGVSGAALLDSKSRIIAFIPDSDSFSAVSGILVINSQQSNGGALPYETVMYVDGKKEIYPRASSISSELAGHYGTLLLDGNGYASAFVSDESEIYTTVKNAVLLEVDTVSKIGRKGCVELLVNSGEVYYEKMNGAAINAEDVGKSGTLLVDPNGMAVAFFPDGKNTYTVVKCTVVDNGSGKVALAHDGAVSWYGSYLQQSKSPEGALGRAIINEYGEVTAFVSDGVSGSVYSDSVLLSVNAVSPDGDEGLVKLLIKNETVYFEKSGAFSEDDLYKTGILITDYEGLAMDFYPDETEAYTVQEGIMLEWSASKLSFLAGDVEDGSIKEYKYSFSPAASMVGQSGGLLLDAKGKACGFFKDDSGEKYTLSSEGILISTHTVAQDKSTITAKFYSGGRIETYVASYLLDDEWKLSRGKLLLDPYGDAVWLIETSTYSAVEFVVSSTLSELDGYYYDYDLSANTPVIKGIELMTWREAYTLLDGEVTMYFDRLGNIELIYAEK